jgi:hypothetical protein
MKKIILLLAVALSAITTFAVPVIIHVSPTGSSSESVNGLSWANAVSLDRGRNLSNFYFSQSTPVDNQVWVKAGTYNLTAAFNLNANMSFYGGFIGSETDFSQRNWVTNQTIINQTGTVMVIFGNGLVSPGVFTDYNVLLDGFILQGGNMAGANGCGSIAQGTTLRNCILRNNKATTNVGALGFIAVTGSTKKISLDNCLIINNQAGGNTAALSAFAVPADIINCTFANNYAGVGTASNAVITATAGAVHNFYNNIFYNNLNGSSIAKAIGNNTSKVLFNNAWDSAPTDGVGLSTNNNISISSSPFVSATSYVGAANGVDKLASAIESANFKLATGSSCINAGNNTYATATSDLAGNNRIQNTTVDIGCYEVTPTTASIAGGNLNNTGLTNIQLSNTDITISSGEFVIDASKTVKSITISEGAKLTHSSGTLSATNGITLESSETATATLKDNYSTPTITATVKQHVTAGRNWYLSSPVSAADYSWLSRGTSVQGWSEASKAWVPVTNGTLVKGKGYVQVATTVVSPPSVTGSTGTVNVTGTTNSGDVAITVSRTESGSSRGFNLIGNPYPSYLKWSGENGFIAEATNDSISTSFWYRTKNASDAYVFTTWNGTANVVVGGSEVNSVLNEYIPPMQAFWIRVNANAAVTTHNVNLTFKNNMRFHGVGDNNKFKAPKANERRILRLQLVNGSSSDETLIYFDADADNTFDNYDSPKMMNNSSITPDLYTKVDAERLVINGLSTVSDNMELPLGFSLNAAAPLKFKIGEMSNFAPSTKVFLLDKTDNKQTELQPETEYSFSTNSATVNNESRFSLLFRAPGNTTGIDNASKFNAQVFVNANNQISIIAPEKATYCIYNAVGQLIENGIINSKHSLSRYIGETRNSKLNSGLYIVKVANQSTRVIIK